MKKDDLEGELPRGFLNVGLKKGKWVFTSMELVSRRGRCWWSEVGLTGSAEKDECKDEGCVG